MCWTMNLSSTQKGQAVRRCQCRLSLFPTRHFYHGILFWNTVGLRSARACRTDGGMGAGVDVEQEHLLRERNAIHSSLASATGVLG